MRSDRAIAAEIAYALLIEPVFHTIERGLVVDEFDNLYRDLIENCAVYLGFRLLPASYASYLTVTRPYYRTRYVLAVTQPEWRSLADLPVGGAIGTVAGSTGDLRLIQYLLALEPAQRQPRLPLASYERALGLLQEGTVVAPRPGVGAMVVDTDP